MTRVIYIGGYSRSGSTLLDRLLGQLQGVVSTGELGYLTTHGIVQDRLCGCGCPFSECPFWQEVGQVAFGGWNSAEASELVRLYPLVTRHRYIPLMLSPDVSPSFARSLRRYTALLGRLFETISKVSGCDTIIDSTVDPSRAFLLRQVPGVEVYPVQLVRDSRGAAYSWTKRQIMSDSRSQRVAIDTFAPYVTAVRWTVYHLLFEMFQLMHGRRLRVRYEDLVEYPERELGRIISYARIQDLPASALGFLEAGRAHLGVSHTTAGNGMRLSVGATALRLDEQWRHSLRRRDRVVVTLLTMPLLARYRRKRGVHRPQAPSAPLPFAS